MVPGLLVVGEGRVVAAAGPRPVVDDHSRQVVQTAARVRVPRTRQLLQQVVGHVQPGQGELDRRVELGPGVGRPAEPFDVETENVGQAPDPELFGRRLFRLAAVAEEPFRVGELLGFDKLFQTIVDLASGLLITFTNSHLARFCI